MMSDNVREDHEGASFGSPISGSPSDAGAAFHYDQNEEAWFEGMISMGSHSISK